ncbi:GDT1-like protein 3 [Brassica napus]|uniref:GDT1-like protein 3 n=1 Tax=Brassica napus TaxID=3708 RepID=UPI0020796602|nr:GDT1-like protein 3 [Brassica napus]
MERSMAASEGGGRSSVAEAGEIHRRIIGLRNLGLTRNRKDLVKSLAVVECLGALGLNLESTGPGVFDALFSSFSMILVTEGLSIDHSLRARETTKTSAFVAGLEY